MPSPTTEANKDAGRTTIFSAISVVVTYAVNSVLPETMPSEVKMAILTLVLAGVTYGIAWVDSYIHNQTTGFFAKCNGITKF